MATFLTLVNNVLTELNEPTLATSADLSSASTTVGIQTSVKENVNISKINLVFIIILTIELKKSSYIRIF